MVLEKTHRVWKKSEKSFPGAEDRYPLLFASYFDEEYPPHIVRSRSVSKGAAAILGRWPNHISANWIFAFIGLVSLLVCFFLVVILLITTTTPHHGKRHHLINKCRNNDDEAFQLFRHKTSEPINESHSIYIIEIPGSSNDGISNKTVCGVESYVSKIQRPVYYIQVTFNTEPEVNSTLLKNLEKKYKNFKLISLPARVLFKNTIFQQTYNETGNHFSLLVKVLMTWNFGGLVIDSKLIAIKPYQEDLLRNNPYENLLLKYSNTNKIFSKYGYILKIL